MSKVAKAKYMREYRKKNPHIFKNMDLKKRFGITLKDYEKMLKEQNGVCAICGEEETVLDHRTKEPRSLAVDHDHQTDEIRGLLCTNCNRGIGHFQDNIDLLAKAISYLA